MKWTAILGALGHAALAAAQHLDGSPAAEVVITDGKKTLSDAANAAVGFVQQNAGGAATSALADGLTKLGLPAAAANLFASAGIAQGETFLGQLASAL